MADRGTIGFCKDCGAEFALAETARRVDVARGLSEPERCPACRKSRSTEIRSKGAIFAEPPKETDNAKRCWNKRGLAYIQRKPLTREPVPDESLPPDLPLRWLKDPDSVTDPQERRLAELFARIAPAAEALVANLEDPNGTRVSVLIGPTGTGKSTWAPYRILKSKIGEEGRICVTQPRLVTLRRKKGQSKKDPGGSRLAEDHTTPGFIARELLRASDIGPGHEVGVQYGGEYEMQDRYTKLLYVTDGTLINWLQDGRVGDFDVVFVDEAHEQSANMEQIFALLKYRLPLYPRLRVVIASATADVDRFRNYFGDGRPESVFLAAPDEVSTATPYPIHDRALEDWVESVPECAALSSVKGPTDLQRKLSDAALELIKKIRGDESFTSLRDPDGDILLFVPTVRQADTLAKKFRSEFSNIGWPEKSIVVSHARASEEEREAFRALEARAKRAQDEQQATDPPRVVIATNYAETSVTFHNLRYVIDSGLILEPNWNPDTCCKEFQVVWHSAAGCTQRKGRAGRKRPGEYFRLFPETVNVIRRDYTLPELARQPLDSFLLSAKAAGIEDLSSFQWMSRSAEGGTGAEEITRAVASIRKQGGLDEDGDLTAQGLELRATGASRAEIAACLSLADHYACAAEVSTLVAFTELAGGMFNEGVGGLTQYARFRSNCRDDLDFYLRVYHQWDREPEKQRADWAKRNGLSHEFLLKVQTQRENCLRSFRRKDSKYADRPLALNRLDRVRLLLAYGLREWLYVSDGESLTEFRPYSPECPYQGTVQVDERSACVSRPDLSAFVCMERTSNPRGVFAQHIVQVDSTVLDGLSELGPVGISLRLRQYSEREEGRFSLDSQNVVESEPSFPSPPSVRDGDVLGGLRVIRKSRAGESRGLILAEHEESGGIVFVSDAGHGTDIGRRIRAVAAGASGSHSTDGVVQASQKSLYEWYGKRPDETWNGQVVELLVNQDSEATDALLLQLEPGVLGLLRENEVHLDGLPKLATAAVGDTWEVAVVQSRHHKESFRGGTVVLLTTAECMRGSRKTVEVGTRYKGRVRKVTENTYSKRPDFVVELLPGLSGTLPGMDAGIEFCETVHRCEEEVSVVVGSNPAPSQLRFISPAVFAARKQQYAVGRAFLGKVAKQVNEKNGGDGLLGVEVEFQPGVTGWLPARHFSEPAHLFRPAVGKSVDVAIREKREGKYTLRLFPSHVEGERLRGQYKRLQSGPPGDAPEYYLLTSPHQGELGDLPLIGTAGEAGGRGGPFGVLEVSDVVTVEVSSVTRSEETGIISYAVRLVADARPANRAPGHRGKRAADPEPKTESGCLVWGIAVASFLGGSIACFALIFN